MGEFFDTGKFIAYPWEIMLIIPVWIRHFVGEHHVIQ